MQVRHITKNTLKITLNSKETRQYFGTINLIGNPSERVAQALRGIFKSAKKLCGFFDYSSEMLVEILAENYNSCSIYCTCINDKSSVPRLYYLAGADSVITLHSELAPQHRKQIMIIKFNDMYFAITEKGASRDLNKQLEKISIKTQIVSPIRLAYIKERGLEITL